jgi:hypothetical protein
MRVFEILVLVGVGLWGVNALPFIDATMKKVITVLAIVLCALWLLPIVARLAGAHF